MKKDYFESAKLRIFKIIDKIVIVIALLLILSVIRSYIRINKSHERIDKVQDRVTKLEQEKAELAKELENASSEEFVEKQLRDKLGLAKEGEIVIVLPDPETVKKFAPEAKAEEETLPDPNWKKWAKLFGVII